MAAFFDQCDATGTCPVCGHPLKAYDGADGVRMLACTGGRPCTWVIRPGGDAAARDNAAAQRSGGADAG
jgi:ssDNA-binding Zn-finger/Zn-ribbon topoisomerase 1